MASKYFNPFRRVKYRFGDNEPPTIMQDLSQYVDLVDQVKENLAFAEDYTILSGERPDTVSTKLYGTDSYYWTFFLFNDHIREQGWPIANEKIRALAKERYPHRIVTTKDDIASQPYGFSVGQKVQGATSGTIGTILQRRLDMGQLVIDTTNTVTSSTRTISIDVNENGVATDELTVEVETFHSPTLWKVFKDDVLVGTDSVTVTKLGKGFEITGIPFGASSTYTAQVLINTTNPSDNNFNLEQIYYVDPDTGLNIAFEAFKESEQYNAIHHYERTVYEAFNLDTVSSVQTGYDKKTIRNVVETLDNGELRESTERVDVGIGYENGARYYNEPANAKPVTFLERLENENNKLKQIKVIKPDAIESIAGEFKEAMIGKVDTPWVSGRRSR